VAYYFLFLSRDRTFQAKTASAKLAGVFLLCYAYVLYALNAYVPAGGPKSLAYCLLGKPFI